MAEQRREHWKMRRFLLKPDEQAEILKLWPSLKDIPDDCAHQPVEWAAGEFSCFLCGERLGDHGSPRGQQQL